jgi:hypothetical protein
MLRAASCQFPGSFVKRLPVPRSGSTCQHVGIFNPQACAAGAANRILMATRLHQQYSATGNTDV